MKSNLLKLKLAATCVWVGIWLIIGLFVALFGHGSPHLQNPMGSPFEPAPLQNITTFAILGDCHSFRVPLRDFVDLMEDRDVDFAILTGDFTDYDDDLAYHHFVWRLRAPKKPIFLVRGNHEAVSFDNEESDRYKDFIPDSDYAFVHAGTLFLFLDSSHGTVSSGAFEFARDRLETFRKTYAEGPIFLFTHYPPSIQGTGCSDLTQRATKTIMALCDEFTITRLYCGHVHERHEFQVEDMTVIVDGCGGGSMPARSPDAHAQIVTVDGKTISTEMVALGTDWDWMAKLEYLLFVSVLRYRGIALLFIAIILGLEAFHVLRRRRSATMAALAETDKE